MKNMDKKIEKYKRSMENYSIIKIHDKNTL